MATSFTGGRFYKHLHSSLLFSRTEWVEIYKVDSSTRFRDEPCLGSFKHDDPILIC